MDFSDALNELKGGRCLARYGWNSQQQFIFLVKGSEFEVNRAPLLGIFPPGTRVRYGAHIDIKAANGEVRPWLASQADLLANDWHVVHWHVVPIV